MLNRIKPSISKAMLKEERYHKFEDNVAYANVENSLEEILTRSEIVKDMFEKGEIGIVGGVYNVENGEVDFFKNLTRKKKVEKKLLTV
jgi:carbonic anhydrase